MNIVKMRNDTDCEVAMIATICDVDYETAQKAIGWKQLEYGLENPAFGNPYNIYLSLLKLGFWKQNIIWKQLQKDGKFCVLIHFPSDPYFKQHWIIRDKMVDENHYCYFGKSEDYTIVSNTEMKKLFLSGFPNCAFKVYKCNIFVKLFHYIRLKLNKMVGKNE